MKLQIVFLYIFMCFSFNLTIAATQASQYQKSMYFVSSTLHEPCCQVSLKCTCFPSVKRCCCRSIDNKVRPYAVMSGRPKLVRHSGIVDSKEVKSVDNGEVVQEHLPE